MQVEALSLKTLIKKYVTKRNVLVFLLVFIIVGWFTNSPIIKWPYYRTKRVITAAVFKAFPILYLMQYQGAAGGSMAPPEDKDVPGLLVRRQFSGKELEGFYQEHYIDAFKGKDIFKTEFCGKGTFGFGEHKAYDDKNKFGDYKKTLLSHCHIFMRVAIGPRVYLRDGVPGDYPPDKAYIQLRDGTQYFEQEITDSDYREVFQKVIDDKLFELDLPKMENISAEQLAQFKYPIESTWTGLYLLGDDFCSIYSTINKTKIQTFKDWMIARYPNIRNYPVTEFSTHDLDK